MPILLSILWAGSVVVVLPLLENRTVCMRRFVFAVVLEPTHVRAYSYFFKRTFIRHQTEGRRELSLATPAECFLELVYAMWTW